MILVSYKLYIQEIDDNKIWIHYDKYVHDLFNHFSYLNLFQNLKNSVFVFTKLFYKMYSDIHEAAHLKARHNQQQDRVSEF